MVIIRLTLARRDSKTKAKQSFPHIAGALGPAGSISALVASSTAEDPIGLQSRTSPQAVLYQCVVRPVPSNCKISSLFVYTWLLNVLYYFWPHLEILWHASSRWW